MGEGGRGRKEKLVTKRHRRYLANTHILKSMCNVRNFRCPFAGYRIPITVSMCLPICPTTELKTTDSVGTQ